MSGIFSGIGKVFKTVASVATKVLLPVAAVGAALFTGGASGGLGSLMSGAFSLLAGNSGGVLGNIFNTALGRAGAITGDGSGGSGLMSALGGQMSAGAGTGGPPLGTLDSAPGMVNPNVSAPSGTSQALVNSSTVPSTGLGGVLAGLGGGLKDWAAAKQAQDLVEMQLASREKIAANEIAHLEGKEQRLRDSYNVSDATRFQKPPRRRYQHDPQSGMILLPEA